VEGWTYHYLLLVLYKGVFYQGGGDGSHDGMSYGEGAVSCMVCHRGVGCCVIYSMSQGGGAVCHMVCHGVGVLCHISYVTE